jgi:hypothetical protein
MLLYLFDGFSFAKYMIFEIIDAGDDKDEPANQTDVAIKENAISANTPAKVNSQTVRKQADEDRNTDIPDEASEEAEYVPYSEHEAAPVQPVVAEKEEALKEDAEKDNSDEAVLDLGKLLESDEPKQDDQVTETSNDNEKKAPDEPDETKTKAEEISPIEFKYIKFAAAHNKPEDTLQVSGMSGDLFDVWVDGDTICFLNDLTQAAEGRGIRSAVISFGDVSGFRFDKLEDGAECVVLTYMKVDETREIRFTKESFVNFKRVMEQAGGDQ